MKQTNLLEVPNQTPGTGPVYACMVYVVSLIALMCIYVYMRLGVGGAANSGDIIKKIVVSDRPEWFRIACKL